MSAAVIDVRDLQTHIVTRWGTIKAVDGVSFAVARGRDARARRRVGLRQEHDVPEHRAARAAAGRAHRRRPGAARRRGPPDQERARDAADPRPPGRDDPAGPDELAQPRVLRRHADARAGGDVPRAARPRAAPRGPPSCWPPCASPRPRRGCAPSRTSSRAACGSASSAPWPSPGRRACSSPTSRRPASTSPSRPSTSACSKELQERHRLAMIFVTHNLGIVARICDRVAVMYAGRIVEIGPVRRIFTAPAASLHAGPARRRSRASASGRRA